MGSEIAELWTVLRVEGQPFAKGLLTAQAQAEESATRIGKAWTKLAQLGKASAAVVVVAAGASVKLAMDFDQQMTLVHTQAGASVAEVQSLSDKVLALAGQVGIGPTKLAEGLYHVESAGFRGAEAMSILAAAAKDAAIGQSDLETTTQALIGVMASGIGGVKDAADAAAILNATVGIGDMRMDKLAQAIATGVLPSFKTAGLSMVDFSAALATLTDNVTPADEAATRLRMTVALMSAPSSRAVSALSEIGLSATSLANDMKKPNGLLVAVDDLKAHLAATFGPQATDDVNHYVSILQTKGLDAANKWADSSSKAASVLERAFGGGRTSGAILTLLGETDRLKSKYDALGTSGSRAAQMQDAWQTQQKQFSQQLRQLGASAESAGVKIGNTLIPPLEKGLGWLTSHQGALKAFAIILGTVMVAAMVSWTAAVVANTIAMLADPMTWIVLAIIAAIALLVYGIYELVKHWGTVWGWIKRIAGDVWGWLVKAWEWTWGKIKAIGLWIYHEIIQPIVRAFDKYLVQPLKFLFTILTKMWQFAFGFWSTVINAFVARWKVIWGFITSVAMWAWKNLLLPTFDAINKYGIKPVEAAIRWLLGAWEWVWGKIKIAASAAWGFLKVIWGYVKRDGIDKVHDAVVWLGDEWKRIWDSISGAVTDAWNKYISPIIGKITGAIDKVKSIAGGIWNDPASAGKSLAHMLGFAEGGWVPGPVGAPQLAVVHGGEYILSHQMLTGGPAARAVPPGVAVGAGRPAPTIVHNHVHVYLDGDELKNTTIRSSQRTKLRNNFTGNT